MGNSGRINASGVARAGIRSATATLFEVGHSLLDFIYPPACWVCDRSVQAATELVCAACLASIQSGAEAPARCARCGCPSPSPRLHCLNCAGWPAAPDAPVNPVPATVQGNPPRLPDAAAPAGRGTPCAPVTPGDGPAVRVPFESCSADPASPAPTPYTAATAPTTSMAQAAPALRQHGFAFERAVVLGPYEDTLRQAIHVLKFRGCRRIGTLLGRLLGQTLRSALEPVKLIVPVPLHPARQRQRGFNQSEWIAAGLAEELGRPWVGGVLRRTLPTRQQARLDAATRARNLGAAFQCSGPLPEAACVAVVDDVLTTGSTVDACARVLRQAGARRVWAVTVASRYRREALAWRDARRPAAATEGRR